MLTWIFICLLLALLGAIALLWQRQRDMEASRLKEQKELRSLQREKKIIFEFLHDLGEAFTENIDLPHLLKTILRCAENVCEARGGAIYLWDANRKNLTSEAILGVFPPPFLLPDSIVAKVARHQEYLDATEKGVPEMDDLENVLASAGNAEPASEPEKKPQKEDFSNLREEPLYTRNYLEIPLRYRSEFLGMMALANRKDGGDFTATDFEVVKSIADQAAFALHNVQIYHQLSEKKKMDHDLRVAREIQRILLPSESPKTPHYEICALNLPAQRVSGDYYDFLEIDATRRGLVIADVSGKGIPASLIMAMCRSVLRSKAPGNPSPAQVLREVNRQLYPDILEDMFITMIYAIIDTSTHELKLARAGHEAPLLCCKNFKEVQTPNCPGMALGIDSGKIFDELIRDVTLTLLPGDTIMLYTDGINEALDHEGKEFGRDHLKEALMTDGPRGVNYLVRDILDQVRRFSSGHAQNDDITLAALQRLKEPVAGK
jgi:sigma-B regulation protein RsbU (phosphoserine phosphatase)